MTDNLTPRQLANKAKREAQERAECIARGRERFKRDPEFERHFYAEVDALIREQHGIENLDAATAPGLSGHCNTSPMPTRANAPPPPQRLNAYAPSWTCHGLN
jgi:hypothetical protein